MDLECGDWKKLLMVAYGALGGATIFDTSAVLCIKGTRFKNTLLGEKEAVFQFIPPLMIVRLMQQVSLITA